MRFQFLGESLVSTTIYKRQSAKDHETSRNNFYRTVIYELDLPPQDASGK